MVLLLFWLVLPDFGAGLVNGLFRKFNMAVPREAWLAIGLVCGTGLAFLEIHDLRIFVRTWSKYARGDASAWGDMTRWIRGHTPPSAIFIAPPWKGSFWLEAERAEVVNFKRQPHNNRIQEWYARLVALNGAPFHSVGFNILKELQQHYPALDCRRIESIRDAYGADYYLTTRQRGDLSTALAHRNGTYFLYDLHVAAGLSGLHAQK